MKLTKRAKCIIPVSPFVASSMGIIINTRWRYREGRRRVIFDRIFVFFIQHLMSVYIPNISNTKKSYLHHTRGTTPKWYTGLGVEPESFCANSDVSHHQLINFNDYFRHWYKNPAHVSPSPTWVIRKCCANLWAMSMLGRGNHSSVSERKRHSVRFSRAGWRNNHHSNIKIFRPQTKPFLMIWQHCSTNSLTLDKANRCSDLRDGVRHESPNFLFQKSGI